MAEYNQAWLDPVDNLVSMRKKYDEIFKAYAERTHVNPEVSKAYYMIVETTDGFLETWLPITSYTAPECLTEGSLTQFFCDAEFNDTHQRIYLASVLAPSVKNIISIPPVFEVDKTGNP